MPRDFERWFSRWQEEHAHIHSSTSSIKRSIAVSPNGTSATGPTSSTTGSPMPWSRSSVSPSSRVQSGQPACATSESPGPGTCRPADGCGGKHVVRGLPHRRLRPLRHTYDRPVPNSETVAATPRGPAETLAPRGPTLTPRPRLLMFSVTPGRIFLRRWKRSPTVPAWQLGRLRSTRPRGAGLL